MNIFDLRILSNNAGVVQINRSARRPTKKQKLYNGPLEVFRYVEIISFHLKNS